MMFLVHENEKRKILTIELVKFDSFIENHQTSLRYSSAINPDILINLGIGSQKDFMILTDLFDIKSLYDPFGSMKYIKLDISIYEDKTGKCSNFYGCILKSINFDSMEVSLSCDYMDESFDESKFKIFRRDKRLELIGI